MERFGEFYKNFVSTLVTEDIEDIKDQLSSEGIFSYFGKQAITDRFKWYQDQGIVPTKKFSKNASALQATRVNRGDATGSKTVTVDVDKKEEAEMLTYVFKFLDREVRDQLEKAYKDDPKKAKKLAKHYSGVTMRDVKEDASQISSVLTNWLTLRHDKSSNVPKSIRQKIDFTKLQHSVDEAYQKITGAKISDDAKSNVDADMPEGFSFVKETGNFRLYKWSELGDVCTTDPKVRQNWLSVIIDIAGEEDKKWCVADSNYAKEYGQPDSDGVFKYPYYLLRKKEADGYKPYVLMHGNSLQCKNRADVGITQAMADEIKPAVEEHIKTIVMG